MKALSLSLALATLASVLLASPASAAPSAERCDKVETVLIDAFKTSNETHAQYWHTFVLVDERSPYTRCSEPWSVLVDQVELDEPHKPVGDVNDPPAPSKENAAHVKPHP